MSLDSYLIDTKDYIIDKEIGEGSFGKVYLAYQKNNKKEIVAVKYLPFKDDDNTQKYFIREISIMSEIDHPGLLKLVGFTLPTKKNNNAEIYSRYMPNSTLNQIIKNDQSNLNKILTPTRLSKIVYGIASSMRYLHSKGIIHRDLKPENIFLDENFLPVISDFGLSRFVADDMKMTRKLGTPYFMAPEMFNEDDYSTYKIDVYAFAVSILSLFTTKFEFAGAKPKTINSFIGFILKGKRFIIPKNVPEFYVSLINRCWSHSPSLRPSFDEIVGELENNDEFMFDGSDSKEVHEYMNKLDELKYKDNNDCANELIEETQEFDFNN